MSSNSSISEQHSDQVPKADPMSEENDPKKAY